MAGEVPKERADVAMVWRGGGPFGSGRLIAPGLVLTAGHTIDADSGQPGEYSWFVRLMRQRLSHSSWDGQPYVAKRIWRGKDVDLALLMIKDPPPAPEYEPRFVRLAGESELDGLDAIGFPTAAFSTDGSAVDYRVPGSIRIESMEKSLAFSLPLPDVPRGVEDWKGMSGAVLVHINATTAYIVGAVEEVSKMFAFGKLYVAPVAAALEEDGFSEVVEQAIGKKLAALSVRSHRSLRLDTHLVDIEKLASETASGLPNIARARKVKHGLECEISGIRQLHAEQREAPEQRAAVEWEQLAASCETAAAFLDSIFVGDLQFPQRRSTSELLSWLRKIVDADRSNI